MTAREDYFSHYLTYTANTETPAFFNRWAAISGIGAFLGRQYYFKHGLFNVNPNMYCMLIGSPGTRKSTAIKTMRYIIQQAGYSTIAADKTTKEKFLLDLSGVESPDAEDILAQNIWGNGEGDSDETREIYIMADEFNDFFGNGNIEFISLLGTLWDYSGTYSNRIKNGKSVNINNPTISILGGNTPTGFALAFPTEILGQGFFSRILLIYGEPNGRKIAFPKPPAPETTSALIQYLQIIKTKVFGNATLTHGAQLLLDKIYTTWGGVDDVRFESYSNRRFTHLLKLCLITSAARVSTEINEEDVVFANTVLTHTEHLMPKALGEFGKSMNADVAHKIITLLEANHHVMSLKEIWKHTHSDLNRMNDLSELLRNLVQADKIQMVTGTNSGFLPKRKVVEEVSNDVLEYSFLTDEEKRYIK